MPNHVNSPRGAVQGLGFVWSVNLLVWVPMQQPILNVGSVTANLTGTGLALETTAQAISVNLGRYTINIDYVGGSNPIYLGSAVPGSATSSALWQIKKLSFDISNNLTAIAYAGGLTTFSNIWDNRASLSYS